MKLLLVVALLTAGATAHSISRRAVQRYGNAFDCFSGSNLTTLERQSERNFFLRIVQPLPVYTFFGCLCHGPLGFTIYDFAIARCCKKHGWCYEEAKKLGGCKISEDDYDIPYYYSCSGRKLTCSDKNNACEAAICNCDRQAASCILWNVNDSMYKDKRFC